MSGDSSFSGRQPKAVQSALRVLEVVARGGAGITAKTVAAQLDLPSATTYRLLNILAGEGYVVRLPDLSGFALGHKIGVLIDAAVAPTVCTAARELLAEFRLTVRFGVHLAYYTNSTIRIANEDPEYPLQHDESFLNRHLHASALGKLLLAEKDDPMSLVPATGLTALTRETIVSRSELVASLSAVRADGSSHQTGEITSDTACVAVPLRSATGSLFAGLALSGSAVHEPALRRCVPTMIEAARQLAPLLV
ncbi:IclR family transcriptional regulator C-terminal domain-containing protein [Rhodococcus sp. 14-2483-1-2]|uniref:IclR family transcriptional regulator n=1 Tax=Rhodococcus sp. 14-2483-1-2 TaxID=2023147 RepID=UPI000B9C4F41|nr:IclR family transcriptional regulator C-terminal domain-containing protein [Rhodococcus sp. 14-2483-1-2]OZF26086.1 IclR family transcriptional regulator [Rhodococcus sp. 14-2483-1-2]